MRILSQNWRWFSKRIWTFIYSLWYTLYMKDKHSMLVTISRNDGSAPEVCELTHGETLFTAAGAELSDIIDTPCGGRGTCGKCKVLVTSGDAGPVTAEENKLLTHEELHGGIRLACCCRPHSDISVSAISGGAHTILDTIGSFDEEPSPFWTEKGSFGVAVDIGTTTVVAYLVDFSPPTRIVDVRSGLNSQRRWGADVISRISFAGEGEKNLQELSSAIRQQVSGLIEELLGEQGVRSSSVREIVVAGNTTMLHLFADTDPSSIAVAPFTPAFIHEMVEPASFFDLPFDKARVRVLPSIAGYVGADISAGIAAVGMDRKEGLHLLLDLGTNGEMALGNREKILTCATAAGPAFEGAGISCGTGGVPGAIDTVVVSEGALRWTTIDSKAPVGICGSGILDTVAALLELEIVDDTGAMSEAYADSGYCLVEQRNGQDSRVCFSQKDVRQLQLAKGAVAAGVMVLLDEWGAKPQDISTVYLAGGFGNYLRPSSALAVGLLPQETEEHIVAAKNSAGMGAVRCLLFEHEAERIRQIADKAHYIELSTDSRFQDHFMDQMLFPQR
jgi:uncharacterized 2Fe-2S/4Fe-4S cluster protein (DUF4445 family)